MSAQCEQLFNSFRAPLRVLSKKLLLSLQHETESITKREKIILSVNFHFDLSCQMKRIRKSQLLLFKRRWGEIMGK